VVFYGSIHQRFIAPGSLAFRAGSHARPPVAAGLCPKGEVSLAHNLPASSGLSDKAQAKPKRRVDIISKSAGDETLLYDPATDSIHVLNPTALLVWQLCDGRHSPSEMEAVLRDRFAGTAERDIAADVAATLALFETEGLTTTFS
jgi:hypothetical protein